MYHVERISLMVRSIEACLKARWTLSMTSLAMRMFAPKMIGCSSDSATDGQRAIRTPTRRIPSASVSGVRGSNIDAARRGFPN